MMFDWNKRTYVMGIMNVTPDSFSGDGMLRKSRDEIIEKAIRFAEDGVDIIDVGGESTRPGSSPVNVEDELARVIPIIDLLKEHVSIPLSIDTYKAIVAEEAIHAGASIVNDVWGLRMDPEMPQVVARNNVHVVLMHNRSKPKNVEQEERLGGRYVGIEYKDLLGEVKQELLESINLALKAGVSKEKIIIDPGIGFGKTVEQNLQLINHLDSFKELGYPILLGPSRKSFIGYTLDLPPEERLEGTLASIVVGIMKGANIVRVHDVRAVVRAVRMTEAILQS